MRKISSIIAQIGGNLEELSTERDAAPQPGHFLFRTVGCVAVNDDFDSNRLEHMLQDLGSDITVTVENPSPAATAA